MVVFTFRWYIPVPYLTHTKPEAGFTLWAKPVGWFTPIYIGGKTRGWFFVINFIYFSVIPF
jgi:hypothetical protein